MRSLSAPTIAALESGQAVYVWCILLDFGASGAFGFNTSNWHLQIDGTTYYGAYGLGSISPVKDASGVQGLTLSLDGGPAERIALALDDAAIVQGAAVTLRAAILDTTTYQVIDAPIEFQGYADTMSVAEDAGQSYISLSVESRAVDLLRGCPLTYTDADQQALHAGDRAFEYVVDQTDKQIVWPERAWFFK